MIDIDMLNSHKTEYFMGSEILSTKSLNQVRFLRNGRLSNIYHSTSMFDATIIISDHDDTYSLTFEAIVTGFESIKTYLHSNSFTIHFHYFR